MTDCNKIRDDILDRMIESSFEGYDPSAIFFSQRLMAIKKAISRVPLSFVRRALNSMVARSVFYSGELAIPLLKPQKSTYAKGLALVLSGLSHQRENRDLENQLVEMIFHKKLSGKFLWAHDIDYSFPGGIPVTKQTPNLVTTAFVANAFYDLYKSRRGERYKEYFLSIVEDIFGDIPYRSVGDDKICFMYTPVTDYHVHNANLLYSELLAKYLELDGKNIKSGEDLIERSLRYSFSDFDSTGTYPYAGPPTRKYALDNYHTGYLLRSLNEINRILGEKLPFNVSLRIKNLLKFYLDSFVGSEVVVRDSKGVVQSHSLAETILILKIFDHHLTEEERRRSLSTVHKTMSLLYDKERRCFINNAKKTMFGYIKDSTEMVRWSNAWMFYALSFES